MKAAGKKASSLEREVIAAVIVLYLLLCGAMLGIHYIQPSGQKTTTSSSSPSHAVPEKAPAK